jgi:hypothetical protein
VQVKTKHNLKPAIQQAQARTMTMKRQQMIKT